MALLGFGEGPLRADILGIGVIKMKHADWERQDRRRIPRLNRYSLLAGSELLIKLDLGLLRFSQVTSSWALEASNFHWHLADIHPPL